ncbi:MAG: hypothetical protein JO142_18060 [Burkholderiales bacterium]|nr:hypothetical protein [Burkholderiales bacterium]
MPTSPRRKGITPYWECFPSFFLYPFTLTPLLIIIGLTSLQTFHMIFLGLRSIWLWLVYGAVLANLLFGILEKTAVGYLNDNTPFESSHQGRRTVFKQLAVFLVAGGVIVLVGLLLGKIATIVCLVFAVTLWPASTMVLALEADVGAALDLPRLIRMAFSIGMPYFGLVGCLILLSSSAGAVQALVFKGQTTPGVIPVMVSMAAQLYFSVVMFRLMGYVVYQYHEAVGVDVLRDFDEQGGNVLTPKQRQMAEVNRMLLEGQQDEALAAAFDIRREYPYDIDTNECLFKVLLGRPNALPEFDKQGKRLISLLLKADRDTRAVEVLEQVRAVLPDFQPEAPNEVLPLGKAAVRNRRIDTAMSLIRGFDKRQPKHPDVPAVYLLGARILCEHRRDDAAAEKILRALCARYPAHPITQEAEQLLSVIAQLKPSGAAAT